MEYNQFEVQEELPQKELKKHPIIAIVLLSISILGIIVSLILTLLNGMEQLYTCFYAVSLLTLVLGFNCVLRFKGFCLVFYPIIVLYAIIAAYAFSQNKQVLEIQFPIIATVVIGIYFIQSLYEVIKKKNLKLIILPSITFIASIVLIALFNVIGAKLLGSIISCLFIPLLIFELITMIIEFKKDKKAPVIETKEEKEEEKNEI